MQTAYEFTVIRRRIADRTPIAIDSPSKAARFCLDMTRYDREHLVALYLDTRLQLIGRETVHIGTADACMISPREIFRGCLLVGATQVLVLHNHPSGDPSPSDEDQRVADHLDHLGELMGVALTDFMVVGEGGRFWSRQHGQGRVRTPNHPTQTLLREYLRSDTYTGGSHTGSCASRAPRVCSRSLPR